MAVQPGFVANLVGNLEDRFSRDAAQVHQPKISFFLSIPMVATDPSFKHADRENWSDAHADLESL